MAAPNQALLDAIAAFVEASATLASLTSLMSSRFNLVLSAAADRAAADAIYNPLEKQLNDAAKAIDAAINAGATANQVAVLQANFLVLFNQTKAAYETCQSTTNALAAAENAYNSSVADVNAQAAVVASLGAIMLGLAGTGPTGQQDPGGNVKGQLTPSVPYGPLVTPDIGGARLGDSIAVDPALPDPGNIPGGQ